MQSIATRLGCFSAPPRDAMERIPLILRDGKIDKNQLTQQ